MLNKAISGLLSTASLAVLLAGCDAPGRVAEPRQLTPTSDALADARPGQPIQLLDQCDPATFDQAIGPGACVSTHPGITFSNFISQLTAKREVDAWLIAPSALSVALGTTLVATNRGGEVHTFTRVAAFGGGIVPLLNALSGNPTPRPECLNAPPSAFLPPGGVDAKAVTTPGTALYQCCIHPWMRTTVTVR